MAGEDVRAPNVGTAQRPGCAQQRVEVEVLVMVRNCSCVSWLAPGIARSISYVFISFSFGLGSIGAQAAAGAVQPVIVAPGIASSLGCQ